MAPDKKQEEEEEEEFPVGGIRPRNFTKPS